MADIKTVLRDPKVKIIAGLLVMVALILGFLKVSHILWSGYKKTKQEIEVMRSQLKKGGSLPLIRKRLNAEIEALNTKILVEEKKFFRTAEEILLVVKGIAKESGMSLKSIDPSEKIPEEIPYRKDLHLEMLPLVINARCDYHQLVNFFERVEKTQRFIKVTGFSIGGDASDVWTHSIQIQLQATLLAQ